jgi:cytoskeletal protein CcmA (bactofilin family)
MADTGTVIGEKIRITGQVSGDEDLSVLGWIEGTINLTRTLHVEPSGVVKADANVDTAVVAGVVVGNITASTAVELLEGGRMVGNINAPRVVIADGAAYRGHVDMGAVEAPGASAGLSSRSSRSLRPSRPSRARTTGVTSRASEVSAPAAADEAAVEEVVSVSVAAKPSAKTRKATKSKTKAAAVAE